MGFPKYSPSWSCLTAPACENSGRRFSFLWAHRKAFVGASVIQPHETRLAWRKGSAAIAALPRCGAGSKGINGHALLRRRIRVAGAGCMVGAPGSGGVLNNSNHLIDGTPERGDSRDLIGESDAAVGGINRQAPHEIGQDETIRVARTDEDFGAARTGKLKKGS